MKVTCVYISEEAQKFVQWAQCLCLNTLFDSLHDKLNLSACSAVPNVWLYLEQNALVRMFKNLNTKLVFKQMVVRNLGRSQFGVVVKEQWTLIWRTGFKSPLLHRKPAGRPFNNDDYY